MRQTLKEEILTFIKYYKKQLTLTEEELRKIERIEKLANGGEARPAYRMIASLLFERILQENNNHRNVMHTLLSLALSKDCFPVGSPYHEKYSPPKTSRSR